MTLSLSLIILRNWLLSFIILFALFAATPKPVAANGTTAPACKSAKGSPKQAALRLAKKKRFAGAIACLRAHLAATPNDLSAKARIIRYRGYLKDFAGAGDELASSRLAGTAAGDELAGDLAWYQGHARTSAEHYQKAAYSVTPVNFAAEPANERGAITSKRGIMQAAHLWHKAIRGFRAAGDEQALSQAVAEGKTLLPHVKEGPVKKRLAAALVTPRAAANIKATAPRGSTISYQATVGSEFIFQDRYATDGYSRTVANRGGLRGRNLIAAAVVGFGQKPAASWRLGITGERRERFFSRTAEPVDTIGGIQVGYDFGQPRHALSLEASWVKKPAFTYHNQFTLGYSLPVAVGSVDFSVRHTGYARSSADRAGLGLSYYSGSWLWLPKAYATHVTSSSDSSWQGAVDVKAMAFLGAYTAAGWLGGGTGESSQPIAGAAAEQVGYVAYGASIDRRFAALKAGLSASRHSEPRFHQNTIGLNLLWRR